jgi:hypothetical protein
LIILPLNWLSRPHSAEIVNRCRSSVGPSNVICSKKLVHAVAGLDLHRGGDVGLVGRAVANATAGTVTVM